MANRTTGQGILAFITNHSYLDNPTFRGMRQSLMNTFTDIYILNLHGNSKKKEVTPDGSKDENVFDIQQGVTIGIFAKEQKNIHPASVHYSDLWGPREGKYQALFAKDIASTEWIDLNPSSPFYLFVPLQEQLMAEYIKGWKVTDVFPVNSVGIVTARDDLTIKWSKKEVADTIKDFTELLPEEARDKYKLGDDVRDWKVALAQKDLKDTALNPDRIAPLLYRPFDIRYTYYTGRSRGFHCMPRGKVASQLFPHSNKAIIATRNASPTNPFTHIFTTAAIPIGRAFPDLATITHLFPLYVYPSEKQFQLENGRRPNLNPDFVKAVSDKLGMKFIEDGWGNFPETFGPEDVFNYSYAVLHSPTYRKRYSEFLKIDFPRLPLTSDKTLFKSLAENGAVLVALHLMESPLLDSFITKYEVKGEHIVDKIGYDEKTYRVSINKTQYFEGVSPEVWNFHIGGYQVCEKWLKDRRGRKLTINEINHYQKIVVALKETIWLMQEIDEVIEAHGGWPAAFT